MYSIKALFSLKKSFSARVRTLVSSFERIQRYSYKAKHETSYNTKTYLKKDVVLFSFEKPKFFLAVYLISAAQFGIWTYLGVFFFKILKNPNFNLDSENFWGKLLEKEREHSKILMPASFFFVFGVLAATWFYCFRSIRKIILHKGGKEITLVTYGFPGYNSLSVPINNISSLDSRIKAKKFIPVKVKNKPFYFLLDVTGEFSDPVLFDYTAGVKRAL